MKTRTWQKENHYYTDKKPYMQDSLNAEQNMTKHTEQNRGRKKKTNARKMKREQESTANQIKIWNKKEPETYNKPEQLSSMTKNHHRTNRETKRNAKNNQLRETTSRNTTGRANK